MKRNLVHRTASLALGALAIISSAAWSQAYPNQRVTIVVPFAAGGPADLLARVAATETEKLWKQPVVVENRPGAAGLLGAEYVARQKPDGYTLLLNGNQVHTAKLFMKQVPVDASDIRPIIGLAGSSYLMVVPPTLGVKTLKEFVELTKTKPKQLNFGVIPYNTQELDYYVFQRLTGIQMTMIPYQSAAPQIPALLRGELALYFGVGISSSTVNEGKLVAIGYSGTERHPKHPSVPTAREQGLDYVAGFTLGMHAHSKTPEDIVQKVGRDLAAILKMPEVVTRLDGLGYQVPSAPLDWAKQIDRELQVYTEVARTLNYQPQ